MFALPALYILKISTQNLLNVLFFINFFVISLIIFLPFYAKITLSMWDASSHPLCLIPIVYITDLKRYNIEDECKSNYLWHVKEENNRKKPATPLIF